MNADYRNWSEINALAVKQVGKFAVYVANNVDYDSEIDNKSWDYAVSQIRLKTDNEKSYYEISSGMIHGGLFFFESEEKADEFFNIFCNEITEKTGLYAAIYCPERGCLSENC